MRKLAIAKTKKLLFFSSPHASIPTISPSLIFLPLEGGAVLLEPVMKVEVVTPEENMGDVVGDLNRRRGLIQGMDDCASGKMVNAEVPLSEMFGYATDLRSATQGRATYAMEFLKYSEAPKSVSDSIINR